MKNVYFYSVLALAAMLFASCNKVEQFDDKPEVLPDGRVEVLFGASGGGSLDVTEITRASWNTSYDGHIGIFAFNEDGTEIFDGYSNMEYAAYHNDTSGWRFTSYGDGIYYSADESVRVKFLAYYPYQENLENGNVYKVDLTQNYRDTEQLLWTDMSAESYNKTSDVVNLEMQNKYSIIRILLRNGGGYDSDDVNGATLTISDMPLKADFNLYTGEMTVTETGDLTFSDLGVSAGYYIYVVPTAAAADRAVTVTLANGDTYVWEIGDKAFDEGYFYEYHLRLNKTESSFYFTIEDQLMDVMGPYDNIDLY